MQKRREWKKEEIIRLFRKIFKRKGSKFNISEEEALTLNLRLDEVKVIRKVDTEVNLINDDNPMLSPTICNSERKIQKKSNIIFLYSSLIKTKEETNYILGLLNKNVKSASLLYKMSQDGPSQFHEKCDNISSTLSLIQIKSKKNSILDKYRIYGGYTEEKWDCSDSAKEDLKSFIFSFTDKSEPFYKINSKVCSSIVCSKEYGPSFGFSNRIPELWIKGKKGGYDNTYSFGDTNRVCTGGNKLFDVAEIEVYQIIYE